MGTKVIVEILLYAIGRSKGNSMCQNGAKMLGEPDGNHYKLVSYGKGQEITMLNGV